MLSHLYSPRDSTILDGGLRSLIASSYIITSIQGGPAKVKPTYIYWQHLNAWVKFDDLFANVNCIQQVV